jgi:hypothetical protein
MLYLRTGADQAAPQSGLLLDWFGGSASTVSGSLADLTGNLGSPRAGAIDLLRLAVAVYGADRTVLRERQTDRWTRALQIHVPVSDPAMWRAAAAAFAEALAFLTNDAWRVRFRGVPVEQDAAPPLFGADAVSLFSGGLDSLVGAIDLLEEGRTVLLVGHYDSNLLLPRQQHLFERLREHYGDDRVQYRPFYLRLNPSSPLQMRPLPRERENTTRSRSFLFIAAAGVVASILQVPEIEVPENGYIGLNVPLESSRLGACSTRTTHPHFLGLLRRALSLVQGPRIRNRYETLTKSEVLSHCANRALLVDLAPSTVSCAHPEVGRWQGDPYQNCGYCYPCLMRRVALHALDADDPGEYRVDVGDAAVMHGGGVRASHIRPLIASARRPDRPTDILSSGPPPRGRTREFADLYVRGRAEIRAWLDAAVPA